MPDLPPVNVVVTSVKLPDEAMAAYQTMQRQLFAVVEEHVSTAGAVEEHTIEAVSPMVATGKCAQMANGFLYDEGNDNPVTIHTVKIEWLRELVESLNGEPLLIAYEFIEDLRTIRRELRNIRYEIHDVPALGAASLISASITARSPSIFIPVDANALRRLGGGS